MDSPKDLPSDLVREILTRALCLTTLDACKLICKDWNQLLHCPEFMPAYCKKTKNLCGFIMQGNFKWGQEFVSLEDTPFDDLGRSMKSERLFSTNDYDVRILASSKQGMLFAAGVSCNSLELRFYVGKPSIGYWLVLPLPNLGRYKTVMAALVVLGSNPFRYKIIRLSHEKRFRHRHRNSYGYYCEVFDTKTWEWQIHKGIELGYKVYLDGQPVTVGNLVHWLTTDHQVLAFNCGNDTYFRFPLPEAGLNEHDSRCLVEYEGKLGLMYTRKGEETTHVWVRNNGSWRLVKEFELEISLKSEEARPVGLYNRDTVVLTAPEKVVFYSLQDSSILRSVKTNTYGIAQKIFPFRSDFEQV